MAKAWRRQTASALVIDVGRRAVLLVNDRPGGIYHLPGADLAPGVGPEITAIRAAWRATGTSCARLPGVDLFDPQGDVIWRPAPFAVVQRPGRVLDFLYLATALRDPWEVIAANTEWVYIADLDGEHVTADVPILARHGLELLETKVVSRS